MTLHRPGAFLSLLLCTQALAGPPDLVLQGTVTGQDLHTYRLLPFDVPPGTTRLSVDFHYTTQEARTAIDLGILGPDGFRGQDGFRGWSGGNKHHFTLGLTDATPSYLPGPITAGRWTLLLGIPGIRPSTHADYTAEVRFERNVSAGPVLREQAGWYRGDLHSHSAHSDGACLSHRGVRVPCPVFLTAQTARERGLDFIALTEHNTVSHADALTELQPYFDDLLLLPGREITTFQGHANLFGTVAPVDFRVGGEVPGWQTLLGEISRLHGLLSINHPIRPSGEDCMGCGWTPADDIDYTQIQAVEVVNGLDADTPGSGVPFWEHLLNQGYHLTGIGGSDSHDATKPALHASDLRTPGHEPSLQALSQASGALAVPTTVVYATALSQPAILAGIASGRVFIDVGGCDGCILDLTARTTHDTAHMGETLKVRRGTPVHLDATLIGGSGEVELILDGQKLPWNGRLQKDEASQSLAHTWRATQGAHWVRLTVRDADGHTLLIGNPIYFQAAP